MDAGTLNLTNSILFDNHTAFASGGDLVTGAGVPVNADHNDIGDRTTPMYNDLGGNISTDPLVDRQDFRLAVGSPAIDAGTCIGAPSTDFEGDTRPSGGACDIGADEFVP